MDFAAQRFFQRLVDRRHNDNPCGLRRLRPRSEKGLLLFEGHPLAASSAMGVFRLEVGIARLRLQLAYS
jgi:hypothetical protein